MLQDGQTYFKNLCLTNLQHYEKKELTAIKKKPCE